MLFGFMEVTASNRRRITCHDGQTKVGWCQSIVITRQKLGEQRFSGKHQRLTEGKDSWCYRRQCTVFLDDTYEIVEALREQGVNAWQCFNSGRDSKGGDSPCEWFDIQ